MHAETRLGLILGLLLAVGGCAVTPPEQDVSDPLEPVNRVVYKFNDAVDRAVMKPLAKGYQKVVPSPVRTGVRNFFGNLGEPLVIVNDVLQGKLEQALADTGRFVFNTTFGILGIFDVATSMQLPEHDEDFGQTFGRWGFGEGWYLVLPILGPSTVRDAAGLPGDHALDALWYYDQVAERNILIGLRAVDRRAQLLSASRILKTAALDEYYFTREAYRQRRWNLIYDGNPPPPTMGDFEGDSESTPPENVAPPAAAPSP